MVRPPPGPACSPATTSAPSTASRRATPRCSKARGCCAASRAPRCGSPCCAATPRIRTIVELTREELPALAGEGPHRRAGRPATCASPSSRRPRRTSWRPRSRPCRRPGPRACVVDLRGNAFGEVEAGSRRRACSCRRHARLPAGPRQGEGSHRRGRSGEWRGDAAGAWCSPTTAPPAPRSCSRARCRGTSAREIIGERTRGRAARQKLVKLPDGSGLLLTHLLYLAAGWRRDSREGPRTRRGGRAADGGLRPDAADRRPDPRKGPRRPAEKKAA